MRRKGPISRREMQVLSLLAEHRTYEDISSILHISIITAYDHVYSIMSKTGIHKRELLIKYAIDHGFRKRRRIAV
jgi:DNA-binding CsgD family transcriptional regulator